MSCAVVLVVRRLLGLLLLRPQAMQLKAVLAEVTVPQRLRPPVQAHSSLDHRLPSQSRFERRSSRHIPQPMLNGVVLARQVLRRAL
jgi:hypothetical protein